MTRPTVHLLRLLVSIIIVASAHSYDERARTKEAHMPATKANGWKEDDCLGGPCASPDECCIPCCCLCFRDACAEINGKGIAVQSDGEDGGGDEEGGNDEGNEGDCCGAEGKVEDYAKRIIVAFVLPCP